MTIAEQTVGQRQIVVGQCLADRAGGDETPFSAISGSTMSTSKSPPLALGGKHIRRSGALVAKMEVMTDDDGAHAERFAEHLAE